MNDKTPGQDAGNTPVGELTSPLSDEELQEVQTLLLGAPVSEA